MRARRVAVAVLVLLTTGCAILQPRAKENASPNVNASDISAGYALLYDLVSKEKQGDEQLRLRRSPRPPGDDDQEYRRLEGVHHLLPPTLVGTIQPIHWT
jgi:hypothetical protein